MRDVPAHLSGPRRDTCVDYRSGDQSSGLIAPLSKNIEKKQTPMPTASTDLAQSAARLKRLVPRLRGKRIGVVGDLMLDRYLWGSVTRISPEAVVPVVDFEGQKQCLGGA